jgi:hypothetical protein
LFFEDEGEPEGDFGALGGAETTDIALDEKTVNLQSSVLNAELSKLQHRPAQASEPELNPNFRVAVGVLS